MKRLFHIKMLLSLLATKSQNISFLFFSLLFLTTQIASPQSEGFSNISIPEGLSQSSVLDIEKDNLGRMWFATRNGLNCWDGVRMRHFFPEPGDTSSLMSHLTREILISGKFLWARSTNGLSRINLKTMKIRRYYLDGVQDMSVYQDILLLATRNGLLKYNSEKQEFYPDTVLFSERVNISKIFIDRNDVLWIIESNNGQIIKIENTSITHISLENYRNIRASDVLLDKYDRLWIASREYGIFVYNQEKGSIEVINEDSSPFFLNSPNVRALEIDAEGNIWAGTFSGLSKFDIDNQVTTNINSLSIPDDMQFSSIHSMFMGENNHLWIGTYRRGIFYKNLSHSVFHTYFNPISGIFETFPVIGQMIEDEEGNLWIATEGGGLEYYDRFNDTFKNYPVNDIETGTSAPNIKCLYLENNEALYIGMVDGGLNILDIFTGLFRNFEKEDYPNAPGEVGSIVPYKSGYVLGTDLGLLYYNKIQDTFQSFANLEGIDELAKIYNWNTRSIFRDSRGRFIIGIEGNKLLIYDPENKSLERRRIHSYPDKMPENRPMISVMEDHSYRIWIGTNGGGLLLFDTKRDTILTFNKATNGLPSNFILGISESRYGNIWLSTSTSLTRFDVENEVFYNYDIKYGLPLNELNEKALLLTRDGELFIGGIDGLISFHEENLISEVPLNPIIFSSLHVNQVEVDPQKDSHIIKEDISYTEKIVLKPKYKVFTIGYSALNYNSELLNKYEYKLEGFDEEWIRSEYSIPVTYTNLNPGKYIFKIRATNAVYKPIGDEKSVEIIIIPPFYRTLIAFIIYGLMILGLILFFNSSYLGKIRLRYELHAKRSEIEKEKELNQYKLRFFTNVSHEFMTPLTIILSSIENIFSGGRVPAQIKNDLNLAYLQTKRLKKLNTELLDFRKIEQGYLKLKFIKTDIIEYVENIYNSFSKMAEGRSIKYVFDNEMDERRIYFDPVQLDKVFYNLLSNAFKHVSESEGRIILSISEQESEVLISVRNNGKVIAKKDIEKVFNRFIQLDDEYKKSEFKGSGIGLALSQSIVQAHQGSISCESSKKEGTMFEVRLPKGKAHIDPDLVVQDIDIANSSIDEEVDILQELEAIEYRSDQLRSQTGSDNPAMLIVDDDQEIRSAVKRIFSDRYQIITAKNGKEGLEMALKIQPEIIISDVVMPTMSGLEMLKKLKRNLNTSHIPIVLLTALDSNEDHSAGLYSGADAYINKPFDTEILNATVTSLFQNRKLLQEKFNLDPESNAGNIAKNIMDQEFIKKAQAVVERHLTDFDFNVDEFSSKMNIRRTLFYHKVKNITGQTPNDFIQTIRLKHAAKMILTEPSKNISEIAYDTGFNSPRYFSQCFKNHFGVTPSVYVKEQDK